MDEYSGMEKMKEDRQVFSDLFDRIDPHDNGDLDEKEWMTRLQRLAVDISAEEMRKLFKLMDSDIFSIASGYIDRQDWIFFCTSCSSQRPQRLHDSVLSNIYVSDETCKLLSSKLMTALELDSEKLRALNKADEEKVCTAFDSFTRNPRTRC